MSIGSCKGISGTGTLFFPIRTLAGLRWCRIFLSSLCLKWEAIWVFLWPEVRNFLSQCGQAKGLIPKNRLKYFFSYPYLTKYDQKKSEENNPCTHLENIQVSPLICNLYIQCFWIKRLDYSWEIQWIINRLHQLWLCCHKHRLYNLTRFWLFPYLAWD